jgi:hypothetical protein
MMAKRYRSGLQIVDNLGDVDPINYGGFFVLFNPETGDSLIEVLEEPHFDRDDKPIGPWYAYRFEPERLVWHDGGLRDNPYHPCHKVWFSDKIKGVAESAGIRWRSLVSSLCSSSVTERARGYQHLVGYFGVSEFDSCPLDLGTNASRVKFRYLSRLRKLRREGRQ